MVHAADTRSRARAALIDGWDRQRQADPDKSRIILTHTNAEVRELNIEARERSRTSPEQMAQRISVAGSVARLEDQAALAKAGEDKARVMAELRAIAGSAWTRADQRNRQLWFGLGGAAIGALLWAAFPRTVARSMPESWLWPEKIAARTLRLDRWTASRRLAATSQPDVWEYHGGGIYDRPGQSRSD